MGEDFGEAISNTQELGCGCPQFAGQTWSRCWGQEIRADVESSNKAEVARESGPMSDQSCKYAVQSREWIRRQRLQEGIGNEIFELQIVLYESGINTE